MSHPERMRPLILAQQTAQHGVDSCRTAGGCCTVPGYALRDWRQPRPRGLRGSFARTTTVWLTRWLTLHNRTENSTGTRFALSGACTVPSSPGVAGNAASPPEGRKKIDTGDSGIHRTAAATTAPANAAPEPQKKPPRGDREDQAATDTATGATTGSHRRRRIGDGSGCTTSSTASAAGAAGGYRTERKYQLP